MLLAYIGISVFSNNLCHSSSRQLVQSAGSSLSAARLVSGFPSMSWLRARLGSRGVDARMAQAKALCPLAIHCTHLALRISLHLVYSNSLRAVGRVYSEARKYLYVGVWEPGPLSAAGITTESIMYSSPVSVSLKCWPMRRLRSILLNERDSVGVSVRQSGLAGLVAFSVRSGWRFAAGCLVSGTL